MVVKELRYEKPTEGSDRPARGSCDRRRDGCADVHRRGARRVRDANGVIPGVVVTLINEATSVARETSTNDSGEYNFSAVPPGTYTVKASLTGFKTYETRGVRIGAQQFVTVDVLLEVGALQETITVTGRRRSSIRRRPRPAARSTRRPWKACRRPAATRS